MYLLNRNIRKKIHKVKVKAVKIKAVKVKAVKIKAVKVKAVILNLQNEAKLNLGKAAKIKILLYQI